MEERSVSSDERPARGTSKRTFTRRDLNPMSFEEYGRHVDSLAESLRAYASARDLRFDAVAPILRSGAIPGGMLAVRLRVAVMLPLQLKCRAAGGVDVISGPSLAPSALPPRPAILVCENNTSSGASAALAASVLRQQYPGARLFYATVAQVWGGGEVVGYERAFTGVRTNERFLATPEEERALGLRPGVTLFPWEVAVDELLEMNEGAYVIDGEEFETLEGFFEAIATALFGDAKWGRNLDAFHDILSWPDAQPYVVRWRSSAVSRERLGYEETVRQLEKQLRECHPSNVARVEAELERARRREGPTVFEWVMEIFRDNADAVEVRLE